MRIAVFNPCDMTPGETAGETRLLNLCRRLSRTHEARFTLLDDMAAGIPILANAPRPRRVTGADGFMPVASATPMAQAVAQRRRASPEARRGANAARGIACRTSAGEHPAATYGAILS